LLKIIMPIFAVPIGRTRREQPFDWAALLLIRSIESDRCRILMEPWGRDGIDLQGVKRNSTKHAVEMRGKQRIQDLSQPVIMERGVREVGLEQGYHPTVLQACPHLIESMMAIENRQEQGLHATATREDMGGVWRTESINERCHVELAYHPQHQR
jgi:hypothetical protein